MAKTFRNVNDDPVTGPARLRRAEFARGGCVPSTGLIDVDYDNYIEHGDRQGFDVRHRFDSGSYKEEVELARGDVVLRYGSDLGRFTAPRGTAFEMLSLPWEQDSLEYHEYVVVADGVRVKCVVTQGIVAPGFDQPGGGIQYYHRDSIRTCIERRELKECHHG